MFTETSNVFLSVVHFKDIISAVNQCKIFWNKLKNTKYQPTIGLK